MKFPGFSLVRPSAELGFIGKREHFIPFRIDILMERMLDDERLPNREHENFKTFRAMLSERFHYEHHALLESLKRDFVPFDPDRDTIAEPELSEDELDEKRLRLYRTIRSLLDICNYRELSPEQLEECLKLQPVGGLSVHVDTADFEEFHVYYRGVGSKEKFSRDFLFRKRTRTVPVLNRVFVMARFKKEREGNLVLKLFKDVSLENIKIIAPKVKLGIPILDRLKIGGTVFGSVATTLYKLLVAVALSWVLFGIVLAGLLLAMFKGVTGFLNSRTKYLHRYSSNLYYRNLSNNKAAITSLVDAAEEQDVKETLLGYFMLLGTPGGESGAAELESAVEKWIEERFGHRLDFEINDAVRKLRDKNLVKIENRGKNAEDARMKVYDLATALRNLDEAWDRIRDFPET